ncbi:MAG TPA: M48 family metalloprotease [Bdellovibrionota bacterium]|nr:M48 family metalloprotease [Bdellovibrionota bacterium]
MNFFSQQDQRRKNTRTLIYLFALSLLLIHLSIYTVTVWSLDLAHLLPGRTYRWWHSFLFFWVTLVNGAVVLGGSLYMRRKLAPGGTAVALMLGGDLLLETAENSFEQRLKNVVEEIAIASGTPVPLVFSLPRQTSINAFAAGHTRGDAVIVVTRGALELLNRDELQGVIAHEFSHLLNGDTRLNLQMASTLYGIQVISTLGSFLIRTGGLPFVVLGFYLYVLGYIGVFFGRFIKYAASRQREYLADASAVQFTRNAAGISGALKKIGGLRQGSRIHHPYAESLSHLFFESAVEEPLFSFLSTHPPLADRIRTIDASFDGAYPYVESLPSPPAEESGIFPLRTRTTERIPIVAAVGENDLLRRVADPLPKHLVHAHDFLATLPPIVARAARSPSAAQHLIYALLLQDSETERTHQIAALQEEIGDANANEVAALALAVAILGPTARLPLIELSLPALRMLSMQHRKDLQRRVRVLARSDRKLSIFEFALERVLAKHLRALPLRHKIQYFAVKPLLPDCEVVLSMLAYAGQSSLPAAQEAFARVGHTLSRDALGMLPLHECTLETLERSLDRLAAAPPVLKQRILTAAMLCVTADGKITEKEGELLRAIADTLDCPLPPFLATQR